MQNFGHLETSNLCGTGDRWPHILRMSSPVRTGFKTALWLKQEGTERLGSVGCSINIIMILTEGFARCKKEREIWPMHGWLVALFLPQI